MTITSVLLEYVAPSLGVLVGNYMWYAPYQDVCRSLKQGRLGPLNPLPWAFMMGNCIGWVTYGVLQENLFVFFGNIFGLLLSVWFNLAASQLVYHERHSRARGVFVSVPGEETLHKESQEAAKAAPGVAAVEETDLLPAAAAATTTTTTTTTPSPSLATPTAVNHDYYTLGMVLIWVSILAVLGFSTDSLTADHRQYIVGIAANINLLYFYAAPLSTIWVVLKTQSTATIHTKTMLVNTANAVFWAIYGLAILDYFVFVPNGLGAILGFVQIGLFVVFRNKSSSQEEEVTTEDHDIVKTLDEKPPQSAPEGMSAAIEPDLDARVSGTTLMTSPLDDEVNGA